MHRPASSAACKERSMRTLARPARKFLTLLTVALVAVLVTLAGGPSPASADTAGHARRHLTVATYNLYLGADLNPLFSATTEQELIQRAGEAYAHVVQTDFPSRAEAVARQL